MPLRSVSAAYLAQAGDLAGNPGQQAAYDSTGHCVVLAGPGSGKTKTLVLKLARIMAEDVRAPRGAACITYSQECARELTRRLERLGLREASNLFIGTVHGFCLRHLLMPYGRLADLPVPFPLAVATTRQRDQAMKRVGDRLFGVGHPNKTMDLGRHRRSVLDRNSIAWTSEEELAAWAEGYEAELRRMGLIDFDDLVVFGQRLVSEHDWVLPLLQAKFPVLAVDEYQDLGVALQADEDGLGGGDAPGAGEAVCEGDLRGRIGAVGTTGPGGGALAAVEDDLGLVGGGGGGGIIGGGGR